MKFLDFYGAEHKTVDYPDIAKLVCHSIIAGECKCGILLCGTGIGMSIAANKFTGIRAALLSDSFSAKMAKEHNNAQIICMGEKTIGFGLASDLVLNWLNSTFEGGRHQVRLDKMENKKIQ